MLFNNKTPLKQNLYMLATVFTLEAENKLTPKLRAHLAERNFVQSTYDQDPADSLAGLADTGPGKDDADETHDQPSAPGDSERPAVNDKTSGRTRPVTRASYKAALLAQQADEASDDAKEQDATSTSATDSGKKSKAATKTAAKNSADEMTATPAAGAAPGAASRKRKATPPAAVKSQAEAGPSNKRPRLK